MSVLAERVKRRWESGQRHSGHMEHLRALNPTPPLAPDSFLPLPLGGHTIEVDTTDIETIDYTHLLAQIQRILGE